MTLHLKLFARARDLAGAEALNLDLPPQATVGDLRRALAMAYPTLSAFLPRCAIAVDNEFAGDHQVLSPSSKIALLPPVSGG